MLKTVSSKTKVPAHAFWTGAEFLFTGRDYFQRLLERVKEAKHSIRIESYIFEKDILGIQLFEELARAAERGVKVRVIVDAIGSPQWSVADLEVFRKGGVYVRVFGRPRTLLAEALRRLIRLNFVTAYRVIRKVQLRNHRKLAIFDSKLGLVGSSNIGETFSEWRETTVELQGPGVSELGRSFARSWRFSVREHIPNSKQRMVTPLRNNFTPTERRIANREFITRVRESEDKIWMTTAYFHPRPKLLLSLFFALRHGVDLRILVPSHSDIAWFPWLSRTAFAGLLSAGARIYEYEGQMLHAKTTVFDRVALVGSRNMNYRSFMHDLELDVELDSASAVSELERLFERDSEKSTELTPARLRAYAPVAGLISFILTPLKRWL
jgi:cardiolipin synthase A/B